MQYELLTTEQADKIRSRFENTFFKTYQEFEISWTKWAEEFAKNRPDAAKPIMPEYSLTTYWNKLKENTDITFDDAISFLKSIENPVYFLSDPNGMNILDNASIEFVATTDDPKSFADFIYDEWKMIYTLPDDVWKDPTLPWDLFVFDHTFNWMLYFTHHNIDDFAEEKTGCDWNRLCIKI